MQTRIATHHFFNPETQRALLENPGGYVSKEESMRDKLAQIRREHHPERFVMMHLGQNPDGCAPGVAARLREMVEDPRSALLLSEYPDFRFNELRVKIAVLHNIHPDWIMLSAGLDQMIDMVAATFIEGRDKFLVTNPGFFLFDEYSRRHGGIPVELNLQECDGFSWTEDTMRSYQELLAKLEIKLIWIANPNNPSGRLMDMDMIEEVIRIAHDNWITVVVDEAYGEYADPSYGVRSASRFLVQYENLIVLRTMSKAYGLASVRTGYALCRNQKILDALRVHRHYYPISRQAGELSCAAFDSINYLDLVRRQVAERRAALAKGLAGLPGVSLLDSESGIAMLRCLGTTASDVIQALETKGILVAPVPGSGVAASQYFRITYGRPDDNAYLARHLAKIALGRFAW